MISDMTYWPDDGDTGERMAQCDVCGRTVIAPSEEALVADAEPGWVFACTSEGDDGVVACLDHTLDQALAQYGYPQADEWIAKILHEDV